jgi:hypothetical protein
MRKRLSRSSRYPSTAPLFGQQLIKSTQPPMGQDTDSARLASHHRGYLGDAQPDDCAQDHDLGLGGWQGCDES